MYKEYFQMSMNFPDETIIGNPAQSTLIIYTGSGYFSYSVFDKSRKGSFFYGELPNESRIDAFSVFKKAYFNNNFFSLPFKKVLFLYRTPVFTFFPNAIYEEKYKEDLFKFHFPENNGIALNHNVLNTGVNVLYQMPDDICRFILKSFAEPEFFHHSEPLITYFSEKAKTANNNRMIVNVEEYGMDILCFSRGTFLLGNYFQCDGLSEALYYILFIWKQLQFNQINDSLLFTGNATFKEELISRLAFYIEQINHLYYPYANHFEGINPGLIPFELAALSVCG